jgi:hypothetical protein
MNAIEARWTPVCRIEDIPLAGARRVAGRG